MRWGWGSPRGRVLARVGLGVVSWVIPRDVVDEAVGDGLAWEMRLRSLPARLGVYFVLGCALLSGDAYGEVILEVTRGVRRALAAAGWAVPATTALTAVRRRVGERPLESVFRRVCSALSPGRAAWSHLGPLLVVAVDGTTIGAADSPANAAAFGRPGAAKQAASPALRLAVLIACGTRGILDAAFGPVRGTGTGEQALAGRLLGSLRPGMLLLADRNFYGWALWHAAAATRADLLWRVKASLHLPVLRELPDGSFLAHVSDPAAVHARNRRDGARRRRGSALGPETGPLPGMTVRVVEFWLTVTTDGGGTRAERYRLVTTLADWRSFPAAALAACYARRWSAEMVFTQLAKRAVRASGGGWQDVADLDLAVGDDHPVDEQFGELPSLRERGRGESGPDSAAECLDAIGHGLQFQALFSSGVQLALLGRQGGLAAVQFFSFALEFAQPDDLGKVGVQQPLLLAAELAQGLADSGLPGVELLGQPCSAACPAQRAGDLGGIGQQRAQVGPDQLVQLVRGDVAGGAALPLGHPQRVGAPVA